MTDLERKAVQRVFELLEIAQGDLRDATEILRQALAQPEQGNSNPNYHNNESNTSLKHEPWCDSVTKLLLSFPPQIPKCNCKLKRKWVGLTDEERERATGWSVEHIESYLKEKNT